MDLKTVTKINVKILEVFSEISNFNKSILFLNAYHFVILFFIQRRKKYVYICVYTNTEFISQFSNNNL